MQFTYYLNIMTIYPELSELPSSQTDTSGGGKNKTHTPVTGSVWSLTVNCMQQLGLDLKAKFHGSSFLVTSS